MTCTECGERIANGTAVIRTISLVRHYWHKDVCYDAHRARQTGEVEES